MLVALGTLLLASSAFAGHRPPPRCANITVKAEGNCPKKGYECDEGLAIKYNFRNEAKVEVQCVDNDAELAVGKRIVDEVKCRGQTWSGLGEDCDISTTSVVCAKSCGTDICPDAPRDAPNQYEPLYIHHATRNSKCAYAECENGFVAIHRNGSLIEDFPASTSVKCSGNGKWNVDGEQFDFVMCKRRAQTCHHDCETRPYIFENLTVTTAIQDACAFTCEGDEVLSTKFKNKDYAIALSCATCTRRGFLVDNDKIVSRIGCITCDIPDGDVPNIGPLPPVNHPATSEGCIATCPKHFRLRYALGGSNSDFAPDRILYRKFTPTGNYWITRNGVTLDVGHRIDCVMEESCFDDDV